MMPKKIRKNILKKFQEYNLYGKDTILENFLITIVILINS